MFFAIEGIRASCNLNSYVKAIGSIQNNGIDDCKRTFGSRLCKNALMLIFAVSGIKASSQDDQALVGQGFVINLNEAVIRAQIEGESSFCPRRNKIWFG